jgi:hypothetical protein
LLGEQDGIAARVLRSPGVRVSAFALVVLELALREALSDGSRFVGTEHILLGVVGEHEGVAVQVLREFDVDAAKIRTAIPAPLPSSRTVVREEPDGPLVVRVSRIRGDDPPEGGGERGDVEQDVDERPGDQHRVAGSRRLINSPDPAAPCVTCVHATVKLQPSVSAELAGAVKDHRGAARRLVQIVSGNAENLSLHIWLSAQDSTGRRIHSSGRDFGISGPRRGIWHRWHGPPLTDEPELADRIMLFEHRVDIYDIAGVQVIEPELIDAPLTVELTPEVQAEVASDVEPQAEGQLRQEHGGCVGGRCPVGDRLVMPR